MEATINGFDIETTNLKSSFGHIICCSFLNLLDPTDEPITFSIDDPRFRRKKKSDDSKLVAAIKEELEGSWIWAGWYSKEFDIKFVNGRLAAANLMPVEKRMHIDLIYYARMLRLHSSRLDSVAKTFELKTQKTDILPRQWRDAGEGDKESIRYVIDHCEADVRVLRDVFPMLMPLITNIHK